MSPLVKVNRLKMSHFGNRVYLGNTYLFLEIGALANPNLFLLTPIKVIQTHPKCV